MKKAEMARGSAATANDTVRVRAAVERVFAFA